MDFSTWIQSPSDWSILFLPAVLIGMSKTGIQGISLLAVPLMALTFDAKPSTGLILPVLCFADLIAVLYYCPDKEAYRKEIPIFYNSYNFFVRINFIDLNPL